MLQNFLSVEKLSPKKSPEKSLQHTNVPLRSAHTWTPLHHPQKEGCLFGWRCKEAFSISEKFDSLTARERERE